MYCHHCGKEMGEADTFCPYCGAKLNNISPAPVENTAPKENQPSDVQKPAKMSVLIPIGFSLPFLAFVLVIVLSISAYSAGVLLGALAVLSAAAGLIISIVGKVRGNKLGGNKAGNRLAIAGIVLSAVMLLFSAEAFLIFSIGRVFGTIGSMMWR